MRAQARPCAAAAGAGAHPSLPAAAQHRQAPAGRQAGTCVSVLGVSPRWILNMEARAGCITRASHGGSGACGGQPGLVPAWSSAFLAAQVRPVPGPRACRPPARQRPAAPCPAPCPAPPQPAAHRLWQRDVDALVEAAPHRLVQRVRQVGGAQHQHLGAGGGRGEGGGSGGQAAGAASAAAVHSCALAARPHPAAPHRHAAPAGSAPTNTPAERLLRSS